MKQIKITLSLHEISWYLLRKSVQHFNDYRASELWAYVLKLGRIVVFVQHNHGNWHLHQIVVIRVGLAANRNAILDGDEKRQSFLHLASDDLVRSFIRSSDGEEVSQKGAERYVHNDDG